MEKIKVRKRGTQLETTAWPDPPRYYYWYTDLDGIIKHIPEGRF